jgi:hypothetical protein
MGTVIKYPRAHGRHEASQRGDGVSAVIIILPVVRIERRVEAPSYKGHWKRWSNLQRRTLRPRLPPRQ